MSWADICKVTGHRSIDTLIKSYILSLEGEGLANAAKAIGSGPDVAQGAAFEPVQLVNKKRKTSEDLEKRENTETPGDVAKPDCCFELVLPEVDSVQMAGQRQPLATKYVSSPPPSTSTEVSTPPPPTTT